MKNFKVYIAGNYSADNIIDALKNIGKGLKASAEVFNLGFAPFAPWADRDHIIQMSNLNYDVSQFHAASMAWLEVSNAAYVISGVGNGGGVDAEIKRAKELGIPVFYNLGDLMVWRRDNILDNI